jgi:hypothetical protein
MAVLSRRRYLVLLLTLVAILIVQSFPGPPGFLSAVAAAAWARLCVFTEILVPGRSA